jgi:hypothetical protein
MIASAAIIAPALVFGVPSNLDLTNHFRFALPFHDAISSGDLYPWLAGQIAAMGPAAILRPLLPAFCITIPDR